MSLYEALGVNKDATPEQIKAAYRSMAQKHHPDRDRSETAGERMQAIQKAYEVLKDKEKRHRYDTAGESTPAPDINAVAMQSLTGLFAHLFEANDFESRDYVHLARVKIDENVSQLKAQSKTIASKLAKAERLLSKVEGDAMVGPLSQKKQQFEAQQEKIIEGQEVSYCMLELLEGCKFVGDLELPEPVFLSSGSFSRNIDWGRL